MGEFVIMRHLTRMTKERVIPLLGACVLFTGGISASVLLGAGSAQAAPCPGTPVVAGTSCTDTGTLTYTGGTLALTSPTALTWAGTGNGLDQQLVDATTAHQSYVVDDATGSGAGWHVTVSATTFSSTVPTTATLANTGTFSTNGSITSAVATTGPTAACTSGATCTVPTDTGVTYPVAMTTALTTPTAVSVYNAPLTTGLGSITIGLPGAAPVGWWVAVPANAVPGLYTSTVTLEVLTAP
jgi:hypothetical protein